MTSLVEHLDKIDAALRIAPQSEDELIAYPIIEELRDHHANSLKALIMQEIEKSEINRESFLLLRTIGLQHYPENTMHEVMMNFIIVREQLRRIIGLPRLTATGS